LTLDLASQTPNYDYKYYNKDMKSHLREKDLTQSVLDLRTSGVGRGNDPEDIINMH
jgi:hypothetical protein